MVELVTDTGARVTRLRTDKTNEYSVDGVVLKAFGSEPPTEVFEALGIDPYSVQSQMEPPFLLAASAGEVAQILNKAASIDDIDNTLGGLKRAAGRIARDINYNNEQLTKYTLQLEDYRYLDDLAGGALPFTHNHPLTGDSVVMRFDVSEEPKIQAANV